MAANDDFQRGVTLSSSSPSGPSGNTITFPATPGIAWVLTDINAVCDSGIASAYNMPISTSLGTNGPQGTISFTVATGAIESGQWSWSGRVAAVVGAALSISIASVANAAGYLTATAYPI